MKSSLLLSVTLLLIAAKLSATPLTDCKALGKDATGCDKCFDMGSVYEGKAINKLDLTLDNFSNDTAEVMFLDNWGSFQYSVLQPNSKFSTTIGNSK